jgi:hypothetical protein
MREKHVDLVVAGTHSREGSVAERIFRGVDCLVLTVGSCSFLDSPLEKQRAFRRFLFATDFSTSSLDVLPWPISFAYPPERNWLWLMSRRLR